MSESVNYHCPACNGTLKFQAETGQLQCDYCGSVFTVAEVEEAMAAKQAKADAKDQAKKDKESARVMKEAERVLREADEARAAGVAAAAAGEISEEDVAKAEAAAAAAKAAVAAAAAKPADASAAATSAASAKDPIQAFLNRAPWTNVAEENVAQYSCPSCGAELLVDKTTAITECPYCGNQDILPNQVTGAMKPDYVIPFKVTKDQAMAALKKHYEGKPLLPNAFKDQNHVEHIQGVYVPFWLYSYRAEGKMKFKAERIRVWVDHHDDTMQETTTFACHREGAMEFKNVPADGSSKMPDAHMDAIEPFDYSEMVPFSVGYLPGFAAERYDVDADACKDRTVTRMETSVETALAGTVDGYDNVITEDKQVKAKLESVHYALLPVWMLHTRWNDKDYLFAMNGQTGKFIGDLPIDGGKVAKWFLGVAVPTFAAVFGLCQFLL